MKHVIINKCFSLTGQDYIYTGQPDGGGFIPYQQNHNQYINPSEIIPFRQAPAGFQPLDPPEGGSYLHPDLQTSDLPVHLRQSLPQYRFPSTPRTEQPINVSIMYIFLFQSLILSLIIAMVLLLRSFVP